MPLSLALMSTILTAGIVVFLIVKCNLQLKSKGGKSPPSSPPSFPVSFWKTAYLFWRDRISLWDVMAQFWKHGKLHGIHVRSINIRGLLINDYELAKELYANPIFRDRPQNDFWRYYARGNYGEEAKMTRHEKCFKNSIKNTQDK